MAGESAAWRREHEKLRQAGKPTPLEAFEKRERGEKLNLLRGPDLPLEGIPVEHAHFDPNERTRAVSGSYAPAGMPASGCVRSIPYSEYEAEPGCRASLLWALSRSPAHSQIPRGDTPALLLGRALHCMVLEPSEFPQRYAVMPHFDRRTKEGKAGFEAFKAQHPTAEALDGEQAGNVDGMFRALRGHGKARELLLEGEGQNEVSLFWDECGIPCKARLDRLRMLGAECAIVDIKSCRDARAHAFCRDAIWGFGYHIKLAWYCMGARACGFNVTQAWLTAVESEPPYGVVVYRVDQAVLDYGAKECRRLLAEYAKCSTAGRWPGYDEEPQTLGLPPSLAEWEGE